MAIRPDLREELMKLPGDERPQLADELYESVTDSVSDDPAWNDALATALRDRIAAIREGRVEGLNGDEVLAEERARLEFRRR